MIRGGKPAAASDMRLHGGNEGEKQATCVGAIMNWAELLNYGSNTCPPKFNVELRQT